MTQAEMKIDESLGMKAKGSALVQIVPLHGGLIQATVKGFPVLVFNPMRDSLINRRRAEFKGWKCSWEDTAAVSAGADGKTSPQEKYDAMVSWRDYHELGSDNWSAKAAGRAPVDVAGNVIAAMIRLGKAKDVDHAERRIVAGAERGQMDRDGFIRALAATADIKVAMAEIKAEAERAKNPLNSDSLLAGMDDEDGVEAPF